MKRSALKRRTSLRRRSRPRRITARQIRAVESILPKMFKAAARDQRVCAACGLKGDWEAHHVVAKQELPRLRLPEWDPRNALRLCSELAGNCHSRHEHGHRRVRLSELTDDNIAYAFEVLGIRAYEYLHRHYDGLFELRVERALRQALGDAA